MNARGKGVGYLEGGGDLRCKRRQKESDGYDWLPCGLKGGR